MAVSCGAGALPDDLWLDTRTLGQTGPYPCRLCRRFFGGKNELVIHYVLDHDKAFCNTCRYVLRCGTDWTTHRLYHLPLRCSTCDGEFTSGPDLRAHHGVAHGASFCRLCDLVLPLDEEYGSHLLKKHTVTALGAENGDELWTRLTNEDFFSCHLCEGENLSQFNFFGHFKFFHRLSLRCLIDLVNGRDKGFSVIDEPSSNSKSLFKQTPSGENITSEDPSEDNSSGDDLFPPEVDSEAVNEDDAPSDDSLEALSVDDNEGDEVEGKNCLSDPLLATALAEWGGKEDYDSTLVEFFAVRRHEIDYLFEDISNANLRYLTPDSRIDIRVELDFLGKDCPFCPPGRKFPRLTKLIEHVVRFHLLKYSPNYTCRICMTSCHRRKEMEQHYLSEGLEFENLYLCQVCECEFDSRELVRKHLSSHWDDLKSLECTSPAVGLKCRFCSLLFWHESERERHHCRSHYNSHRDQFYKCGSCHMLFSDKIWWASHEIKEHADDTEALKNIKALIAYRCTICYQVFRNIDKIKDHFLEHHPSEKRIYCAFPKCFSRPYNKVNYLKQHHRMVHRKAIADTVPLKCEICGRMSKTIQAAKVHHIKSHKNKVRLKCKVCQQHFSSSKDRKLHLIRAHPDHLPFFCTVCNKGYKNKSALYSHRTRAHSVNKVPFVCSYCNKSFAGQDTYKEHLLIHTGPRHRCPFCSRIFVQRSNLIRHIRIHTGEKPYSCAYCEKTFTDKGACTSHTRTHTRENLHVCPECGQEYVTRQKYKQHMLKHSVNKEALTCTECQKEFANKYNLQQHMKLHGTETLECSECDKCYSSQYALNNHIKTVHKTKPIIFTCPLCSYTSRFLASLRHHVITHSSVKYLQCLLCKKEYNDKRALIKHLQKWHETNVKDDNFSKCFNQLDPYQCNLGLDEETLNKIFGPDKKGHTKVFEPKLKQPRKLLLLKNRNIPYSEQIFEEKSKPSTNPKIKEENIDQNHLNSDSKKTINENNTKDSQLEEDTCNESEDSMLFESDNVIIKSEPMDDE